MLLSICYVLKSCGLFFFPMLIELSDLVLRVLVG